jgi:hypothetical protein
MTNRETPPPDRNTVGVAAYSLWCMASLVVMTMGVMLRRADVGMLAPMFLGGVSLLCRWRLGPVFVLSALVLLYVSWWFGVLPLQLAWNNTFGLILSTFTRGRWLLDNRPFYVAHESRPVSDLLMTLGYLAFAAGNYRLLSMTVRLFPLDPRRRPAPSADRRPPLPLTRGEVIGFVLALLGCVTLAAALASWSGDRDAPWNLSDESWQLLLLLWLIGALVIVVAGVLRTLASHRITRDEALMLLQDIFWNETRGEQRRLNRWLTWSWLRRRRREDQT